MLHLYLKSLHIIAFVSWFAGLFYLVRIFVYHAEINEKPENIRQELGSQYLLMMQRAYSIICNPAMLLTWVCGISMLINTPIFLTESWFQVKLCLLLLLSLYHFFCGKNIARLKIGLKPFSSFQYRLLNELPTLFLVSIVLLAVVKDLLNFLLLFIGILLFGFILFLAARAYKRKREEN